MSTASGEPCAGLRILGFSDYFSADSCGGSDRVALEVYRRLPKAGADVTVVTATPRRLADHPPIEGVTVSAVRSLDLAPLLRSQVSIAPGLMRRARAVARACRPDVLHANTLHFQTSIAAARLARTTAIPLVVTVHVGSIERLPRALRTATVLYEGTVGRYILRSASHVIAVSTAVAHHVATLGVRESAISIVPNGVDRDRFHPDIEGGMGAAVPVIAFVGRLMHNKGPHVLVRALRRLHERRLPFRCVFAGEGPMRAGLEREVRRSGMADAVQFIGQSAAIPELLRAADILVRPSFTEGMPLTILEAMATRVCVVASDIAANAELIDDGVNGYLVAPDDDGALAHRLGELLASRDMRTAVAKNGFRTAQAFSWDRCVAETATVLARAAHRDVTATSAAEVLDGQAR